MTGVRALSILWVAVGVAGCSQVAYSPPSPPAATPEARMVVQAPFEQAWTGVVRTLFESNVPIQTIEKASGIIETGPVKGQVGVDCNCGTYLGIPVAGYGTYGGDAYYNFRIFLEPEGQKQTAITLRSSCRGQAEQVPQLQCVLDPKKESEIRSQIQNRVSSVATAPPAP